MIIKAVAKHLAKQANTSPTKIICETRCAIVMSIAIVLTATDVAMEITAPQMIFVGEVLACLARCFAIALMIMIYSLVLIGSSFHYRA